MAGYGAEVRLGVLGPWHTQEKQKGQGKEKNGARRVQTSGLVGPTRQLHCSDAVTPESSTIFRIASRVCGGGPPLKDHPGFDPTLAQQFLSRFYSQRQISFCKNREIYSGIRRS